MALEIDGVTVESWNNIGGDFDAEVYESFSYTHPESVSADQVRVVMVSGPGGEASDLRVDGIQIGPQFYASEAPTTWSTGTWLDSAGACVGHFPESDTLHCEGGYFEFGQGSASTIEVFAAGQTGEEVINIEIDGTVVATFENLGGDTINRDFETLRYTHTGPVSADQLRVVLVDGTTTSTGGDRNVLIDAVAVDGVRFETEAPSVYSEGSFSPVDGCAPGFKQSEDLNCTGGYFQFQASSALGSVIEIRAAGAVGEETMELQIDGVTVETWTNIGGDYLQRVFETYLYTHTEDVTADRIRVAFTNDGTNGAGADRNLRVDGITLDGVVYEAEAASVLSTGTWTSDIGCAPGFKQNEALHCNGYLQFDAVGSNTGTIGIGDTQYTVAETAGSVTVIFVRSDGADGAATVDYTTVPASALAGEDYVAQSGTVTFADGQTEQSVDLVIIDDAQGEGSETFNLAIDLVTGATAGQPRTTTITILDDEAPSPGDGNGLQGDYYTGVNFGNLVLSRTDSLVDFSWGGGSPASSLPADNFSVRWSGQVLPLYSETYTFSTRTDDGVRLWVNGELIIDQWVDQSVTPHEGDITLEAGVKYDIVMEYYERTGDAIAKLRWQSPSLDREIIPSSQLFSDPIVPTNGNFVGETVVNDLNLPTAIEFAPTGQMFIAYKDGRVKVFEDGSLVQGNFIDLRDEVNNIQDRGLLGLELDPDFLNQPYVYLLYTYDPPQTLNNTGLNGPDGAGNRVSRLIRVTADASNGYRTFVPGSEVILLGENSTWGNISSPNQDGTDNVNLPPSCQGVEDCIPVDSRSHSIGALAFAPDGSLFVTNGDGTSFGRVDPRTVRVQDLDSLAGKVLRIDPETGEGISDNPFYDPANPDSNQSKVYHYGLRNPFRMAIHPETGEPYVSDVGWNSWEEINGGEGPGQNYGWPFYEGGDGSNRQTGGYSDLPEAAAFYANNNATPPAFSRSHADGGVAMVIGDFYTGSVYPEMYQGTVFYTDFGDPTIRALTLNADGSVAGSMRVTGSVGAVVEMTMGPDGLMYYVDLNGGKIGRLTFEASGSAASSELLVVEEASGGTGNAEAVAMSFLLEPEAVAPELAAAFADLGAKSQATSRLGGRVWLLAGPSYWTPQLNADLFYQRFTGYQPADAAPAEPNAFDTPEEAEESNKRSIDAFFATGVF